MRQAKGARIAPETPTALAKEQIDWNVRVALDKRLKKLRKGG